MPRTPPHSDARREASRPPGRPAAAQRPDVRDALLEATGRLIVETGASDLSLRRVAAEAGVTPAMVHYYFNDKDGLYEAMLERAVRRILERVQTIASTPDESGPPHQPIADLLRILTTTLSENPWIPILVVREVLSEGGRFRDRFIENYASRMAELLPRLMRTEVEHHRFREDLDPQLAFLSFMGMTVFPFVLRPVIERALGIEYDEAFLNRFTAHTQRLFERGAMT